MTIEQHITTRSEPLAAYLSPARIITTLWPHRQLLWQLIRRGVAARYRGSTLGIFWALIVPLVMLAVYTLVFGVVMRARWGQQQPIGFGHFALILFSGLLLFTLFSESVMAACSSITGSVSLVKKVVFPLEILPIVGIGTALVNAGISLLVLLTGIAVLLQRVPVVLYYLPLVLIPLLLLALGLSWLLASIGVFVRDTGQVVGIVLNVLMYLTPLFYTIEQMPESFQSVMRLNPLSVIVESGRGILMYDRAPDWGWLAGITVLSFLVMQLGFAWFMKTKRGFADVL